MYILSIAEGFVIFGTLAVYVYVIYRFYLRYWKEYKYSMLILEFIHILNLYDECIYFI